mgnify:CR=1 FL=1
MPIRNLLIWGAIALLLVVMFQMVSAPNPARDATERSYSQLINDVITFLIVAFVMFLLARYALSLFKGLEAEAEPSAEEKLSPKM